MVWNWTRLPKSEYQKAITAVKKTDISTLLILHNDYKLSNYDYGCCGSAETILEHYKIAIEKGVIK